MFHFQISSPKLLLGQKVLLVGGDPWHLGRHVEIIDMKNMSYSCELPAKYPIDMSFGAGAMLDGNIPIICGGYNLTSTIKECFQLKDKKWYQIESLPSPRIFMSAGNILIDGKLWISGGSELPSDGESKFDKTFLVSSNSVVQSFDLPIPLTGHCSVYLDEERLMIIGGWSEGDQVGVWSTLSGTDSIFFCLVFEINS